MKARTAKRKRFGQRGTVSANPGRSHTLCYLWPSLVHRHLSTDRFFVLSDEHLTYLLDLVRDQTDLVKYLKGNIGWLEGESRKMTGRA